MKTRLCKHEEKLHVPARVNIPALINLLFQQKVSVWENSMKDFMRESECWFLVILEFLHSWLYRHWVPSAPHIELAMQYVIHLGLVVHSIGGGKVLPKHAVHLHPGKDQKVLLRYWLKWWGVLLTICCCCSGEPWLTSVVLWAVVCTDTSFPASYLLQDFFWPLCFSENSKSSAQILYESFWLSLNPSKLSHFWSCFVMELQLNEEAE